MSMQLVKDNTYQWRM